MMEQARYNPRYLAYAAEHSRTAEEQLANDREEWPGGLMCGFILWNTARIAEYAKINPSAFFKPILTRWDRPDGRPQIMDHAAFDEWLRSEGNTSELQSLMRHPNAVFYSK